MTITKADIAEMSERAQEAQCGHRCPVCKLYPFYVQAGSAMAPGHVYSRAGLTEYAKQSGMCEWCFDQMEPDEERAERTGGLPVAGAPHELPLEGLVLQTVTNLDTYDADGGRFDTDDPDVAQVITSMVEPAPINHAARMHKVVLDIDLPAKLIPSSTEGHFHLYIDKEVPHDEYMTLLRSLAVCGIIEQGYKDASIDRGFTAARLPWVHKPSPSAEELVDQALNEYLDAQPVADGGGEPHPF